MNNWCTLNEPGTWSRFPSPKNSVSGSCYAVQSQDAEAHYYPIFRHTDAPDETTLRHFPSYTAADNRSEFEYARHSRNRFRLPLQNRQCPRTNSLSLSLSGADIFHPAVSIELICGRGTKVISADIFIFYVPFIRSLTRRIFSILKNGRIFNINTGIFLFAMEGQYLPE